MRLVDSVFKVSKDSEITSWLLCIAETSGRRDRMGTQQTGTRRGTQIYRDTQWGIETHRHVHRHWNTQSCKGDAFAWLVPVHTMGSDAYWESIVLGDRFHVTSTCEELLQANPHKHRPRSISCYGTNHSVHQSNDFLRKGASVCPPLRTSSFIHS